MAERFDAQAAWETLSAAAQAEVGPAALDLAIAWIGLDAYADAEPGDHEARRLARAFQAASEQASGRLVQAVEEAFPVLVMADPLPIPAAIGAVCRACGCSDLAADQPRRGWAEPDLCSACAAQAVAP